LPKFLSEWQASTVFSPRVFQEALTTEAIGRFLVYRESVDSTMVVARREAAEGAAHGTIVLAEEQTAGRGRHGRSFNSPAGENLYFTLVLRLPLEDHRRLPVALPVAVCESAIAAGVPARIKWPNDIWVGERKLSGMLIDAEVAEGVAIAMPGVGVNVNGDPTEIPELRDIATSLRLELGHNVFRERVLASICNELEAALAQPPSRLLERYRSLSLILGREIEAFPPGGEPFSAVAIDLAEDGALQVRLDDGSQRVLTAEDVSVRPVSSLPSAELP
jgi:BirA family transcriptional regulator, biotin operon repressor / biotin---[acetyl-CoA-carboxylase] ligase